MEFKDKQSIYLQIADYICEEILLGKWPAGQRIPSVRDLAVMLEVNPNTIVRTYEYLQNKEIIFSKRGIGYSVDQKAKERIIDSRKDRFITVELPEFFKTLELLGISLADIQTHYQEFLKQSEVN